jgi:hypothetical protein
MESFKNVRNYWLSQTYLKEANIREIRIKKSSGKAPVEPFGVLHLEVHSILLQLFIENLIKLTPTIIKKLPAKEITSFLRGLFAAEGSVGLAKTGSVNEINFTSTREDERELVKFILEKLEITSHDSKKRYALRIFGFDNFKRLANIDIFEYHPERRLKFKKGFDRLKASLKIV